MSLSPVQSPRRFALDSKTKRKLKSLVFGLKAEWRLRFRASIIWKLHKGYSAAEVAVYLNTTSRTVGKWQERFVADGIHGLNDLPRSGAPPKFTVQQRCEVIAIACDKPAHYGLVGDTHWTSDTLTAAVNASTEFTMSRSSVFRTLRQNQLKPHKLKMWLHSPDPQFKEKVNDVVWYYLNQHLLTDTVVLCIDEKTGMQAIERKYETQRPMPGRPGRYEYEYIRHGTQSLLAAFNIHTGHVTAHCGPGRTAADLIAFMEQVAAAYAKIPRIIVIWDNLNIHHDGKDQRWTAFNQRHGGKFTFVHTPIHASWLNQVEIFFSILHRRCFKHANFTSQEDLRLKVLAFIQRWNEAEGHAFNWTFRGYPMQEKAVA